MTATLTVVAAGPLMTVQDLGRPGMMGVGLSPGGAMDRLALAEAAALLGLRAPCPAVEMAGLGGQFTSDAPLRFALTGAEMTARIDDAPCSWNATHVLRPGQTLRIGGARRGTYGYLTPAGGIAGPVRMGSLSAHLSVGLGHRLRDGDRLPLGDDPARDAPLRRLVPDDRFAGGTLRLMPGPQTDWFDAQTRARFAATLFHRSPRANRTGLPLTHDGAGFSAAATGSPVSDFIVSGDVQITGDGSPYVMLAECQTIGGYPRIGTIVAADLPRAAQATPDAPLRFSWITTEEADALPHGAPDTLQARVEPLIRDPATMTDLLSHQLIGGVTAGHDEEPLP